MEKIQRDGFVTKLGVITATLGSAIGLGNIWKFPYLTGSNGGAAFLIVYLACTLVVGLAVDDDRADARAQGARDAVTSLVQLAPRQMWWLIGAGGVVAAFLIMAFYTEVAGWVFAYIFKSLTGGLLSTDPKVTSLAFDALISGSRPIAACGSGSCWR